jgi:xanthine/CO dehydrogenase XdhC/CoxF family maturation factor
MKAMKTIRKMTPLARELAKYQRAVHSLEARLTRLILFADEIEQEGRTLRRDNADLRGKLTVAAIPAVELFPEIPDGEALADDTQGCDLR